MYSSFSPTNPLHAAPLHLPFDVAGMNRAAGVLNDRVTQNRDLGRFGIDFDVDKVRAKTVRRPFRIDRRPAHDRPTGLGQLAGQLAERDRLVARAIDAIQARDRLGIALPQECGPLDHLLLDVEPHLVGRQPGGEGHAAAAGHVGIADAIGVGHARLHVFGRDAQGLGQLHGHRRPRASDIGRALDQAHRAIGIYVRRGARLEPDVEPIAAGDPAATMLAHQRRVPVWTGLRRLERLDEPDARVDRPVDAARPLLDGVLQPKLDRIDSQLLGQFVDHRFAGKRRLRGPRRAR